MATASILLSEDQFLCSICLSVFTDPVTTPCGHNFCQNCLTDYWNVNAQSKCPMCTKVFEEVFYKRLDLRVNTFISDMAAKFRQLSSSEKQQAKPGEVLCEVCTVPRLKALKSCLVCLTSYCQTHLEPHQRITGLKRHLLIDPVENLESRMCKKHDKPLEVFCKTDQMCVCRFCTESDHRLHHIVPLLEEYEGRRAELGKMQAEVQQMIQERQLKIQELKRSVKLSKEDADTETAVSVQVFTDMIHSVEKCLAEVTETIQKKHKATEKQAEDFIKELEVEISELMKRNSELMQISQTEDHFQLLQSLPSMTTQPTKNWTEVKVHTYEGIVEKAVDQLVKKLSEESKELYVVTELKRAQQHTVDVTLDPETANPYLILSDDGKQVRHGDEQQNLSESTKRFSSFSVLGKQSFSSGRYYYEVQVKGKTGWTLGVVSESGNRNNLFIIWCPLNGYWTVCLSKGKYQARGNPAFPLTLKSKPEKVGVYVDHEEGLVSFYDVDAASLIYSFTGCSFNEKLYPVFNPCHNNEGLNSSPLIICSMNHTAKSVN